MSKNQQTIVFNIEAEINQVKQAATDMEKTFKNLNLSQSTQKALNNVFSDLIKNIKDFEVASEKGFSSLKDVDKAQKNLEKINDGFTKLKLINKDLGNSDLKKILPDNLVKKYKSLAEMLKKVNTLQSKDNSKAIQAATNKYEAQAKTVNKTSGQLEGLRKENISLGGSLSGFKKGLENAQAAATKLVKDMSALEKVGVSKKSVEYIDLKKQYDQLQDKIKRYNKVIDENTTKIASNKADIKRLTEELKAEQETLTTLDNKLKTLTSQRINTEELTKFRQELANLTAGGDINKIPQDLEGIKASIIKAANSSKELEAIKTALEKIGLNSKQASQALEVMRNGVHEVGETQKNIAQVNSEMDQLKSRLTYFFSAINGVQLFKRAIRSAYESVKELDAAITEMAVVTDYSINDIWGNIPQYTKTATELGATTKDVINSMVLYTQQGLNMSQATELSTQTMKMARIAGLEGAEATDLRKHWVFI